jgi:metal-responsive CopG/Arc/MetJ family transcriptional regulator
MPTYTFSADPKLVEEIDRIASNGDSTRSRIIRGLMAEFIRSHRRDQGRGLFHEPVGREYRE